MPKVITTYIYIHKHTYIHMYVSMCIAKIIIKNPEPLFYCIVYEK